MIRKVGSGGRGPPPARWPAGRRQRWTRRAPATTTGRPRRPAPPSPVPRPWEESEIPPCPPPPNVRRPRRSSVIAAKRWAASARDGQRERHLHQRRHVQQHGGGRGRERGDRYLPPARHPPPAADYVLQARWAPPPRPRTHRAPALSATVVGARGGRRAVAAATGHDGRPGISILPVPPAGQWSLAPDPQACMYSIAAIFRGGRLGRQTTGTAEAGCDRRRRRLTLQVDCYGCGCVRGRLRWWQCVQPPARGRHLRRCR